MTIKNIKILIFSLFILLLSLPVLQWKVNFVDIKKLDGAYNIGGNPNFEFNSFLSGTYQTNFEKYLSDHNGFRNVFIRIYNQMQYTFYNVANANGVIIGKQSYLYEDNYIKAYNGADYLGLNTLKLKVKRLKKINNFLKENNSKLLIIMAPGKAAYYPEYIPDKYKKISDSTNYNTYKQLFAANKIDFIDFHKYFNDNKQKYAELYYPKTGIHWSDYSLEFVIDSFLTKVETETNMQVNKLISTAANKTIEQSETDMDIEKGMNLLFSIRKPKMKYNNYSFTENIKDKPNVLVVSDSFFWQIYNLGISKKVFNNSQFWYYNKQVYPDSFDENIFVNSINPVQKLKETDLVVIISTDANLSKFPWGFDDVLNSKEYKAERIKHMVSVIKSDSVWYNSIIEKAKVNKFSIDKQLGIDAEWMVINEE